MKVYVVEWHQRYEQSEILGVYATLEVAQAAHIGQWKELRGVELKGTAARKWAIVRDRPTDTAVVATEYEVQQ